MNERPIIFSAAAVLRLLEGKKTQTRRPVSRRSRATIAQQGTAGKRTELMTCPYGVRGDHLWVREAFRCNFIGGVRIEYRAGGVLEEADWPVGAVHPYDTSLTRANIRRAERQLEGEKVPDAWRSPIFMPRWASRITLEVAEVRVQRVQDISENDCAAEGIAPTVPPARTPFASIQARHAFAVIWDSLHGPRAWERNGWVWAISFRVVRP